MQEAFLEPLAAWHTFYSIIGSAAATLTGLLFVVIALSANARGRVAASGSGISIFSTPNIVHFGAALLVAALLSAPWSTSWPVSILLGLAGLGGIAYVITILWRVARRLAGYQPVLEDWLWHVIFPFISYAALIIPALFLASAALPALFVIAAATVLLLFIGIHNAWDNVTYIVFVLSVPRDKPQDEQEPRASS
jgi:hypothetical protein